MKRLISLCLAVLVTIFACRASLEIRNSATSNSMQLDASRSRIPTVAAVGIASDAASIEVPPVESHRDNPPDAAPSTLFIVTISPEARVKATAVEGRRELLIGDWTTFQITIENAAGITSPLVIESDQLMKSETDTNRDHWLRLSLEPDGPLTGQPTEKRTLHLYSRDPGIRTALLNVNAGQGTQDLGFRSDVLLSFRISNR